MKRSTTVFVGVGALVTAVLSFLPFAPVAGGWLTGFTSGHSRLRGTSLGAASGLVGFVPVFVVGLFAGAFAGVGWLGGFVGAAQFVGYLGVALVVFAFAYYVLLGAIGGYLGVRTRRKAFSRSDSKSSSDADGETA